MVAGLYGCPDCNPPGVVGQGRTFEDFLPAPGTEEMLDAARNFAAGLPPPGLTLAGSPGCGKTHLLEAIAAAMRRPQVSVRYVFLPDFLDRLRASFSPGAEVGYEDLWDSWAEADVLLLDDLTDGGRPTPWAVGQVERIIDTRYRQGQPYVVTTNGTLASIAETWSRRLADRLFDEWSGAVRVVFCSAPSYRTGRAWTR